MFFNSIFMRSLKKTEWLIFLSLIAISWLALIYIESSRPPLKILGVIPGLDKVVHFAAYSILGLMILAMLTLIGAYKKIPVLPLAVFFVVIAGLFDEFHQAFVPGRNTDAWDLLADFCGGLFFTVIIQCYLGNRRSYHV